MRQGKSFRSLTHRPCLFRGRRVRRGRLARKGSPVEAVEGRIAIISGYRLQFRKFLRRLIVCVRIF